MQTALHLRKLFLAATVFAIAVAVLMYGQTPQVQAVEPLSSVASGDLFRGESLPAVYYMGADGFRYVFPDENTYNTWYADFDDVKFISDSDLTKVQIGGNVTYRPGVLMIKVMSSPQTYAVSNNGVLRHVGSEAVATELYGDAWNTQIRDLADGFFVNYTIGSDILDASTYSVSGEMTASSTIDSDKGLAAPAEMVATDSGFTPVDVTISPGQSVRFTNNGSSQHTATAEDLTWGTGTMEPGGTFIRQFDEVGTYTFFDSYDSSNSGAIYVE
jgi:plastocyanin